MAERKPPAPRYCDYCGAELPAWAGNRARFCSDAHKMAYHRQQGKGNKADTPDISESISINKKRS